MGIKHDGKTDEDLKDLHPTWDLEEGWDAAKNFYTAMITTEVNDIEVYR